MGCVCLFLPHEGILDFGERLEEFSSAVEVNTFALAFRSILLILQLFYDTILLHNIGEYYFILQGMPSCDEAFAKICSNFICISSEVCAHMFPNPCTHRTTVTSNDGEALKLSYWMIQTSHIACIMRWPVFLSVLACSNKLFILVSVVVVVVAAAAAAAIELSLSSNFASIPQDNASPFPYLCCITAQHCTHPLV